MEASAPKRRKTSPTASVPVAATDDAGDLATTPTPAPAPNVAVTTATAAASASRSSRPSFASPTKASMARHNPEILQQRRERAAADAQTQQQRVGVEAPSPAFSRAATETSAGVEAMLAEQLRGEQAAGAAEGDGVNEGVGSGSISTTGATATGGMGEEAKTTKTTAAPPPRTGDGDGPTATTRHHSSTPPSEIPPIPTRPAAGSSRPTPRPLPPPGEETEEEALLNPFLSAASGGRGSGGRGGRGRGRGRGGRGGGVIRKGVGAGLLAGLKEQQQQQQADVEHGRGLDAEQEIEGELPPTPTQQGMDDPVVTTPPGGLQHHLSTSSPSKRAAAKGPRRERTGGSSGAAAAGVGAVQNSSPLKQPPLRPEAGPEVEEQAAAEGDASVVEREGQNGPKEREQQPAPRRKRGRPSLSKLAAAAGKKRRSVTTVFLPRPNAARGVPAPDPNAAKVKERDALLAKIATLEADLAAVTEQNEIADRLPDAGATPQPQKKRKNAAARGPLDKGVFLGLVRTYLLPPERHPHSHRPNDATAALLGMARNPAAWLPFAGASLPTELGLLGTAPATTAVDPDEDELAPSPRSRRPPSHHPLLLSAAEELPFLRVFTPLQFSSTSTSLVTAPGSEASRGPHGLPRLLQHHSISISDAPPADGKDDSDEGGGTGGLFFAARLDFTVDAADLRVVGLAVPRLEPAARAELGPWLERYLGPGWRRKEGVLGAGGAAEADDALNHDGDRTASATTTTTSPGRDSALANNVAVVAWAMNEWFRSAVLRARFWVQLDAEVANAKRIRALVADMRAGKRRRRRRRGEGTDDQPEEEDQGDEEGAAESPRDGAWGDTPVPDEALLPHMGRREMDIPLAELLRGGNDTGRQNGVGAAAGSSSADAEAPSKETTLGLRVHWRIDFDWTGEARSDIGVLVGAPGRWHKDDPRGSLAGVPDLFSRLLKEGEEPIDAVRTVVTLLAGEL